jgi:hypothetical protein
MERRFALQDDGCASRLEILTYQTCCNTLRRLIESLQLNLGRKARLVGGDVDDETMKLYQRELEQFGDTPQ